MGCCVPEAADAGHRRCYDRGKLTGVPMNVPLRASWWSRNWKWCVPMLCVLGIGLFAAACFSFAMFVMNMLHDSPPYREAMQRTRASSAVVAALGVPIEANYLVSGHVNYSGDDGSADFLIPVHGPKGSATVDVEAEKRAGVWRYSVLTVTVTATGRRIDLLRARKPAAQPDAASMLQASASNRNTTRA
jgi:Cytochrome oxidase complex assembly protein 1